MYNMPRLWPFRRNLNDSIQNSQLSRRVLPLAPWKFGVAYLFYKLPEKRLLRLDGKTRRSIATESHSSDTAIATTAATTGDSLTSVAHDDDHGDADVDDDEDNDVDDHDASSI